MKNNFLEESYIFPSTKTQRDGKNGREGEEGPLGAAGGPGTPGVDEVYPVAPTPFGVENNTNWTWKNRTRRFDTMPELPGVNAKAGSAMKELAWQAANEKAAPRFSDKGGLDPERAEKEAAKQILATHMRRKNETQVRDTHGYKEPEKTIQTKNDTANATGENGTAATPAAKFEGRTHWIDWRKSTKTYVI